jgi:putative tricarboxylic transport membrane protein
MNIKNEDSVSGIVLLALASAVTWLSLDMGSGAGGATLPPSFFPQICAAGLAVCGAVLVVRGLLSKTGGLPSLIDRRFGLVVAPLVIFFWGFDSIDFRFGAWVVALVSMWAFGIRGPLLFLYPVAISATLYLTFYFGFSVVLPTWN